MGCALQGCERCLQVIEHWCRINASININRLKFLLLSHDRRCMYQHQALRCLKVRQSLTNEDSMLVL